MGVGRREGVQMGRWGAGHADVSAPLLGAVNEWPTPHTASQLILSCMHSGPQELPVPRPKSGAVCCYYLSAGEGGRNRAPLPRHQGSRAFKGSAELPLTWG